MICKEKCSTISYKDKQGGQLPEDEKSCSGTMNGKPPYVGFSTIAIHVGQEPERWESRAVVPPMVTATTFKAASLNSNGPYCYGRSGNPTRNSLELCLAGIEKSKYALVFASGMATGSTIASLLSAGDHLLTSGDIYGGSLRLFREVVSRMGVQITYVDFTDLDSIKKGMQSNTKMIWLETPTNPLLKVVDIAAVVAIVKKTHPEVIVVADNTFLTPYYQRPLELGADISMCSITKYMNGHSDVIMGSAALNDEGIMKRLKFLQNATGAVPSPFDCYLVNRSLKTLALRLQQHRANSLRVALWLAERRTVREVMHPELPSHPQRAITQKQATGHSGVLSFRHSGGMKESSVFLSSLHVFSLAESLGGYESLAQLPCTMSHGSVPEEMKQKLGITDSLIRLSVGLEDSEDLISDLEQAFAKAFPEENKITNGS